MATQLSVHSDDVYDATLIGNVHPPDWVNPEPAERYNLVVVGAGTAGLISAAAGAGLGAKVALIERDLMGGDCLNAGCVPSKALIRSARVVADVRRARVYGIRCNGDVDFPAVMARMRRIRAELSAKDSAERYRAMGVDVFIGDARFSGPDSVEVGGKTLRYTRSVIATGSRASVIPIPGLVQAGYLTNETVFSLTALPKRMTIIGAGPVGCELAQTFRRFGSEVLLLEAESGILPREDRDAAEIIKRQFLSEGIDIVEGCAIHSVGTQGVEQTVTFDCGGQPREIRCDGILVAVGRAPAVNGLALEAAGVAYDPRTGVTVDDYLRTSNPRIFAAGDVCSRYRFTHMADAMARIVVRNALFFGHERVSTLAVPWCTYTDPEIAHVGLYESEAHAAGIPTSTFIQPLADVDRAVLDGESDGFVKVHVREGSDRIVGATVVAAHAGEMISELTLAIVGELGLSTLARTIHPYPTQAEAIRRVGDSYNRRRLTPTLKRIFERLMEWRR